MSKVNTLFYHTSIRKYVFRKADEKGGRRFESILYYDGIGILKLKAWWLYSMPIPEALFCY